MRRLLRSCAALAAAGTLAWGAGPAQAAGLSLECGARGQPASEAARIAAGAGGVVKRTSPHVLRVIAAGQPLAFTDQPPHDDSYGSERYAFCERKDGFILLERVEGGRSTGTLINEANGAITEAGNRVLLSADRRAYLARAQSLRVDGTEWAVYAVDGSLSWQGYDIQADGPDPLLVTSLLQDPRWEANGELSAQATCMVFHIDQVPKPLSWRVKLIRIANEWRWRPKRACPLK